MLMCAGGHTPSMVAPLFLLASLTVLYLGAAFYQRARRGWSIRRVAAWSGGSALLALGLLPDLLPFPDGDFRKHMVQHLLLGMLAPIGLVMAAPVTLTLRTAPVAVSRGIARLLRSPAFRLWPNPVLALVFEMGGMAVLYFTPLFMAMMVHPALHYLVHFHLVAAGCLYAWVIAGPDPAPHRLSVPARLVILGVAVVIHSVLSQMLYAGVFVSIPILVDQRHQAAELMYYGGDITEMLLAFALVKHLAAEPHQPPRRRSGQRRASLQAVNLAAMGR